MLELYLRSAHGLARARSSLVGSYLDDFAAALHEIGYCRRIGAWCISYAVHLGLWAAAEGVCTRRGTAGPKHRHNPRVGMMSVMPMSA